ncbi:MAG: NUDIX domain-containing protein [Patescibacteria group bacterium]
MRIRRLKEVLKEFPDFVTRVGWRLDFGGDLQNPKLGEIVRVVICRDDGTPMWDQFLHNEPIGAICVPVNKKGEIGLIIVERPIFKNDPEFPLSDFSKLGALSIECPRGFPFKGERSQETAARETDEEIGSPVSESILLGHIRPNSTFHPHAIPVYLVKVDEDFQGITPPDVNEKILRVEWFTVSRVKEMIRKDEIICGITKAALCHLFCLADF